MVTVVVDDEKETTKRDREEREKERGDISRDSLKKDGSRTWSTRTFLEAIRVFGIFVQRQRRVSTRKPVQPRNRVCFPVSVFSRWWSARERNERKIRTIRRLGCQPSYALYALSREPWDPKRKACSLSLSLFPAAGRNDAKFYEQPSRTRLRT